MQQPISQTGMWARGMIYTLIPFLTVLSSDAEFRQSGRVNPGLMVAAVVAGLIGLRAFLDQSSGTASKPVEVEVKNTQSEPIPTAEAGAVPTPTGPHSARAEAEDRHFTDEDGDGIDDFDARAIQEAAVREQEAEQEVDANAFR